MNQLDERQLHPHVLAVAWLNIATNAILLLVGVCGFLFLVSIGLITSDPIAMSVLGIIGSVAVLFFGVLAVPGMLAGLGLLRRARWGQILGIIVGFLSLINFPIGTFIGIYTLWVLLQNAATDYFAPHEAV